LIISYESFEIYALRLVISLHFHPSITRTDILVIVVINHGCIIALMHCGTEITVN